MSKGFRKLFIGGLSLKTDRGIYKILQLEDLLSHFSQFGNVLNAYVIYDPTTKVSKKFGYVEYETVAEAESVMKTDNHKICGKKVTVENQRNGINTAQQLEKRAEEEQKKKGTWSRKAETQTSSTFHIQPVANSRVHERNTNTCHYQKISHRATHLATQGAQIPCYFEGGDVWGHKTVTSMPWLEAASHINQHRNNYEIRTETGLQARARTGYWNHKLQNLLAVGTSNTPYA